MERMGKRTECVGMNTKPDRSLDVGSLVRVVNKSMFLHGCVGTVTQVRSSGAVVGDNVCRIYFTNGLTLNAWMSQLEVLAE